MQEFDVIQQNLISVRGNFIEYSAIVQAEGALRSGDNAISIRADGELVGILFPGETIKFPKVYSKWEITTVGYARVRIGMGTADFVASRGVVSVENAYRTLRGIEYEATVKGPASAGFNYAGFLNDSTNKIIMFVGLTATSSGNQDFNFSFCTIPTPVFTADPVMNKHCDVVEAQWIKPVAGNTAAFAPTGAEMVLGYETSYFGTHTASRNMSIATVGAPLIVTPGKALVVRCMTANVIMSLRASMTALPYGPR